SSRSRSIQLIFRFPMSDVITPELVALGWTPWFHSQFLGVRERFAMPELAIARIVREHRGQYAAQTSNGTVRAVLPGSWAFERPCVGDFVLASSSGGGLSRIEWLFERSSLFRRKQVGSSSAPQAIAANIDLAIVVAAFGGETE